ncbi:DUF4885 family protein, partial [Bacillus velezensis]|uniref:DUF4885 family protein n=1 Tax=Bacillus velezensis TaxID=492670 RepID=UPI0037BEA21F
MQLQNQDLFHPTHLNHQIHILFHPNHIHIPDPPNLTFTISPIHYLLKLTPTHDKHLTQHIQPLLNSPQNTKQLFAHIIPSRSDDSS